MLFYKRVVLPNIDIYILISSYFFHKIHHFEVIYDKYPTPYHVIIKTLCLNFQSMQSGASIAKGYEFNPAPGDMQSRQPNVYFGRTVVYLSFQNGLFS